MLKRNLRLYIFILAVLSCRESLASFEFVGTTTSDTLDIDSDELGNLYFRVRSTDSSTIWKGSPGNWELLYQAPIGLYKVLTSSEHYYVNKYPELKLFRTLDGGGSYTTLTQRASGLAFCNNRLIATNTTNTIFLSDDHGESWASRQLTTSTLALSNISVDGSNVVVRGINNLIFPSLTYEVYLSKNEGDTWNRLVIPELYAEEAVGNCAIISGNIYLVYVDSMSYEARLFVSFNSGVSWIEQSLKLHAPCNIYASQTYSIITSAGRMLFSTRQNMHWIDSGIIFPYGINDVCIRGNTLFIATSDGLYQLTLPNTARQWRQYH